MGRDPGTENPEFELQFRNAATGSIITGNLTEIQVESCRLSGDSVPENEAVASVPACFNLEPYSYEVPEPVPQIVTFKGSV